MEGKDREGHSCHGEEGKHREGHCCHGEEGKPREGHCCYGKEGKPREGHQRKENTEVAPAVIEMRVNTDEAS